MDDKLQEHRGATEGFRSKPENVSRECENITHMRYRWTMDKGPINSTPSRKHWTLHPTLKKKFLTTNYRFKSDGTKVQVI